MRSAGTFGSVRRRAAVILGFACIMISSAPAPQGGVSAAAAPAREPVPSAGELAEARERVRARKKEFGAAAAALAAARARLEKLVADAERRVEEYNGARVRLARARDAHAEAVRRSRLADARLDAARADVAVLAAHSYGGADLSHPMTAVMTGGMGRFESMYQASVLHHMSDSRGQVLRRMREAQEVADIVRRQAAEALAGWREAAERAEKAKVAAQEAVERQRRETRALRRTVKRLEERLDRARFRADRLARRRSAVAARGMTKAPAWAWGGSSRRRGDIAADWALTQLGKPYVWAADGPDSYDCSGLTMRAWEKVGVRLDHWTGTQWTSGPHIPLDRLRRGDLVFFGRITNDPGDIHHVGIYIGRGMMVHAPQTGDVVRIAPIWRRDLVGATRPSPSR
ncbi:C40 family peptidase [Thermostaphylospora chromogena]|uniref:NlpC/P60 family protein n=1 Tax=Thermostaphylospora chromogena TaxID=35622 RepID=A0A1H1C6K0_9ACTN|nr:C40 family peptidase [Thermostaphylospora chromogena]SDQ59700.1 NlpC/P60 family protein [Thermostaphylospora chromogena]